MKTMSAIYQKVRHRLNDDWAFGNGMSLVPVYDNFLKFHPVSIYLTSSIPGIFFNRTNYRLLINKKIDM